MRNRFQYPSLRVRFLRNVVKTKKCWLWIGYTRAGYGRIRDDKKNEQAHRVAWRLFRGPIPAGKKVLHRCDNTYCVRPSHLFLGTQLDNVRDMIRKGRRTELWGKRNGRYIHGKCSRETACRKALGVK